MSEASDDSSPEAIHVQGGVVVRPARAWDVPAIKTLVDYNANSFLVQENT